MVLAALALGGCKSLREMQRPDLVGDSQTKLYYKDVPDSEAKIPAARRVYFTSRDKAESQGYANFQEGANTDDQSAPAAPASGANTSSP